MGKGGAGCGQGSIGEGGVAGQNPGFDRLSANNGGGVLPCTCVRVHPRVLCPRVYVYTYTREE